MAKRLPKQMPKAQSQTTSRYVTVIRNNFTTWAGKINTNQCSPGNKWPYLRLVDEICVKDYSYHF